MPRHLYGVGQKPNNHCRGGPILAGQNASRKWRLCGRGVLLSVLCLLLLGCAITGLTVGQSLAGRWERISGPSLSLKPHDLEFFKDGTYAGEVLSIWPGGKYEIVDRGRVRLETVQGMSVYDFSITDDILTIGGSWEDVQYHRVR